MSYCTWDDDDLEGYDEGQLSQIVMSNIIADTLEDLGADEDWDPEFDELEY